MASSPFSFIPERHWTEEKERALIAFFSQHSCLWNHKSEGYKNRQLRLKTLEHLRILLSAFPPPVRLTAEEIKNKFRNLRTTFQRQHKLVKESEVNSPDDLYVPQWKHYQQLMFLQDLQGSPTDQEEGPDDTPPSPPTVQEEEESKPVLDSQGMIISFLPAQPNPSSPSSLSACVPANMPVKSFWTEEKERALVSFYADHSCLWNKKSEKHNNRQLRLRLLETLRSQLSDNTVPFSVEDIKAKFKNLRTVFNREFKTVQANRMYDSHYMSKWKHYQQMLFLCESCDEDDNQDEGQLIPPLEEHDLELGSHTPSSTMSSISSTQTNHIKFISSCAPSNGIRTHPGVAYQIFLPECPDNLKLVKHTSASALPISQTTSPLDIKPSVDPPTLSFSLSDSALTDGMPNTESRVHWSEAKVRQLIAFYAGHSCLWNHKSESYRNRLLRQSLLKMLSTVLSDNEPVPITVDDIKTKFRNLRTTFQREHKAVSSNQTCGYEDFYVPRWKYYNDLMFLCDSCDEDERPEEVHYIVPEEPPFIHMDSQAQPTTLHYHNSNQTEVKLNIQSQSQEAPPSPTPPDSQRSSPSSSSCTSHSSRTESRVSGRKRGSDRPAAFSSDVLEFMRTVCQNQTASRHSGFLKYVEECLNEMPPEKVKRLKKQIIETIHSASEEV